MRLAACEAVLQRREEPFQREVDLRDEAEVHHRIRDGRVGGDETGIAAHQLHESYAVEGALRLHVRVADDGGRLGHGRLEPEGTPHEHKVVVDRLRHADHGDLESALQALLRHVARTPERPIAADHEEDVDVHAHQRIDNLIRGLLPARGAENRAAQLVDQIDLLRVQHERFVAELRDQPREAEANAEDRLDSVVEGEDLDQSLDDVVESRTESARRQDAHARPARIMVNLRMRTRPLKTRLTPQLLRQVLQQRTVLGDEDALPFVHKLVVANRRRDLALAEARNILRIFLGVCQNLFKRRRHLLFTSLINPLSSQPF